MLTAYRLNKMKIGIFTECYTPVMNGVVVSIETFKKALEARGHEVFVFAPDNDDAIVSSNVYRFPSIKLSKKLYPVIFPSVEIQKTYLPDEILPGLDIIHSQHMFTAGALAKYVAKKYNKPLVYTYHTLITEYANKYAFFLAPLIRNYLKKASVDFCNCADTVVTPSSCMGKILKSWGVKKPIEIIMTGINPSDYKRYTSGELRKKYNINPGAKLLLFVGRIAPEKNILFLLKSFQIIEKKYPNVHLLIVGGGPEEKYYQNEIEKIGLKDKITMTGMLPKEEANKIFGMADIFSYPSYTETQGIVVAEAMASGTVPVAVNKMGPTDLIHDGEDGYLTKLTISDFSDKILRILKDDKLRAKFAENGLKRIEEFSIKTSVDQIEALYKKIAINQK